MSARGRRAYADFETFWKQPNQNQQIWRPTTTSVSLGTDRDSSSSEESHKNLVQSPCKVPVKSSLLIESSSPAGRTTGSKASHGWRHTRAPSWSCLPCTLPAHVTRRREAWLTAPPTNPGGPGRAACEVWTRPGLSPLSRKARKTCATPHRWSRQPYAQAPGRRGRAGRRVRARRVPDS
jgi:hypothetical protein